MKSMLYCIAMIVCVFAGCRKLTEDELWQKVELSRANTNFDSTIQVCQTILKQYPEGPRASAAMYMIAETYQNGKHDYHAAVDYYHAFATKYPDLNSTPVAMFVIGFIYNNNLQMYDSARVAYQAFITGFPTHELTTSAQFEVDNLGKTADEIIAMRKELVDKNKKPSKRK